MNGAIAVIVLLALTMLRVNAAQYEPRSSYDSAYILTTKIENDPATLRKGLVYTETARADAYRNLIRQSYGTLVIGLLVTLALIANSVFIFHLNKPLKTTGQVDPG